LPSWRDSWQDFAKPRSEPGRRRLLQQLFSLVQTCSHTINQSGNGKVCLMKTKTSLTKNSIRRSPLRNGLFLIAFIVAWFALSPQARAVCQEGCLTNENTVLGEDALISNSGGTDNTAIGFNALFSNTTGRDNTATGAEALLSNTTGVDNTAIGL